MSPTRGLADSIRAGARKPWPRAWPMRGLLLQYEGDLHVDLVAYYVAVFYQDVLVLHPRAFDTPEGLGGTGYGLLDGIVEARF